MSAIKFTVTLNPHSDDPTGLTVMELREAQQLMDFIALRGIVGARIIPVDHADLCPCYLHSP